MFIAPKYDTNGNIDESHQRTLDAEYIFVNGGLLEIGTKDYPYLSKLTITMNGIWTTPQMPIFGNSVLAVKDGTLDMHGKTPVRT